MHEPLRRGSSLRLWLSISLSLLILQSAAAENLVSRPVGFVRISVPSNAQVLVSQPFASLCETNSAPVLKWDAAAGYTSVAAAAESGEGFWLVNNQSSNQMAFLAGEVVLSPSNTAVLYPGLNLVGYPYSSALRLNETTLGALTDRVDILNAEAAVPAGDEDVLGKGYWVKSLSEECIVWTEVRPYENVFPASGLPDITGITTKDGLSVALSIACEGGERFDIFYQDADPTNRFDSARNWQLAGTELKAEGQTQIEWIDSGANDRPAPGKVFGRYYLVGRADIDLDGNGVADARDVFVSGATLAAQTSGSPRIEAVLIEEGSEFSLTSLTSDTGTTESTNGAVVRVIGVGRVIYVDQKSGNDLFTGRAATAVNGNGPKKTIRAGLNAAESGGVVVIREGDYSESLNVAGRDVTAIVRGRVDLTGPKMVREADTSSYTNELAPGETGSYP